MSQDADALERAITLACWAHRGQRYPSPQAEPYILHPLRVMLAVQGCRAQMAAVLHDVIEDTEVGPDRLREADLPEDVVAAVVALTHRPDESYEQYIEKVACDGLAREVKLADLADNLANNRRLASTPDVVARINRYEQAVRRLQSPLRRTPQRARPDGAVG
jgi:(p)ppGpp synthase/HD superfamily hydrolase